MAVEPLMDVGLMKRLLAKSKTEPVNCAVGTAGDGKTGLLVLDKIKPPKTLEKQLLKDAPDAKNPRWGTAFVDTDDDPKLVKFQLNKAAPGIARRLIKTLKGTGFNKVIIVLDDGTQAESAGSEEESEGEEPTKSGAPMNGPANGQTATVEAPAQAKPGLDRAAIDAQLRALLPRVKDFQGLPTIRGEIITLVQRAGALLKAEALEEAKAAVENAAKLLDGQGTPTASAEAPATARPVTDTPPTDAPAKLSVVKLAKAALVWRGMWAKADRDLETLRDTVMDHMMSDPEVSPDSYDEIEGNLREVRKITERLNEALADDLDNLRNLAPEKQGMALQRLEKRLGDMANYLSTDEWVGMLADNEFHPIPLQDDMMKAVQTIRAALKT